MQLRELAGRPPWGWIMWANWVIFVAVVLVQLELVWRGRHCLMTLSEALLQERMSKPET